MFFTTMSCRSQRAPIAITRQISRRVLKQLYSTASNPSEKLIEEQTLPKYKQRKYYPVRIGDIYGSRYRILAKLGYGAYSTVWLARDEKSQQYVSMKVGVQDEGPKSPILHEIDMLRHVQQRAESQDYSIKHSGIDFIRLALDIIKIETPTGTHHCIVSKPAGSSLRTVQEHMAPGPLLKALIRSHIHRLLIALNFLHADCKVVHTDLSAQNVLMQVEHADILDEIEADELAEPSVPLEAGDSLIYRSSQPPKELAGSPLLTDFGQMRHVGPNNTDRIMPDIYRAPEVLLGLPWSQSVDIWSLAVMTLELLEGRNLFYPMYDNHYVVSVALAQYIGYIGPPPLAILRESDLMSDYFDTEGNWMMTEAPIPETSLEDFVTVIPPGKEKEAFLRFIRKMLTWDQEARATTNELYNDEWLTTVWDPDRSDHHGLPS